MLFGMSRTRRFIPLLIAFALLPLPLCVQAQTVAAQDTVRAVNEISLLVVVKGKAGEVVEGLSASDFAVEADGRKQLVSSVVREADSPLLVGLVANTGTEQRKALADERKAAMEFVKSLREGRDRAFVMRFSREVELLQDVTTSHERLLKGVDAISVGEQHSVGTGGERRRGETSPGGGILLGGNTLYDAIFLACEDDEDAHGAQGAAGLQRWRGPREPFLIECGHGERAARQRGGVHGVCTVGGFS